MNLTLKCTECGRAFPADGFVYRCSSCYYPLGYIYDYDQISLTIHKRFPTTLEPSIWRYKELLPISSTSAVVSLGEGVTPLYKSCRLSELFGAVNLYLKDETRNPTGSFKDRGSSVGVSRACDIGIKAVGCVSTGNMAASTSAYAAKAGIQAIILIHSGTPQQKIIPILMYGATVIMVDKPYPEIYKAGLDISKEYGIYWVHSDSPARVEGQKTCAYEIWEQMGRVVPDKILVPTSSGGNISAHWKGWQELVKLGLIKKLPSMIAVQAEGCSPIVKAFKEGRDEIIPFANANTIAHAISNPDPPSGLRALRLLRESKGLAQSVSDQELLEAQKLLAETEGIFAEPAGAAAIAALKKLLQCKIINREENIVCIITGTGLKEMEHAMKTTAAPVKVETWAECKQVLRKALQKSAVH